MQRSWIVSSYLYLIIALSFYTIEVLTNPLNSSTHLIKRAFYEADLTKDPPGGTADIPTSMAQCGGTMEFSGFTLSLTPSSTPGYPNLVETLTMQAPVALAQPTSN